MFTSVASLPKPLNQELLALPKVEHLICASGFLSGRESSLKQPGQLMILLTAVFFFLESCFESSRKLTAKLNAPRLADVLMDASASRQDGSRLPRPSRESSRGPADVFSPPG